MTKDDSSSAPNSQSESSPVLSRAPNSGQRLAGRKRNRLGCLNCRQRRRKCNEERPSCQACLKRRVDCHWPSHYVFKDGKALAQSVSDPSVKQALKVQNQRQNHNQTQNFAILDITTEVIREYHGIGAQTRGEGQLSNSARPPRAASHPEAIRTAPSDHSKAVIHSGPPSKPANGLQFPASNPSSGTSVWVDCMPAVPQAIGANTSSKIYETNLISEYGFRTRASADGRVQSVTESPRASRQEFEPSASNQLTSPDHQWIRNTSFGSQIAVSFDGNTSTEIAAEDLLSLRYAAGEGLHDEDVEELPNASQSDSFDLQEHMMSLNYVSNSPDGIFLPGSAYEELHTNLRHHLITAATAEHPFSFRLSNRMDHSLMDCNTEGHISRRAKLANEESHPISPASISLLPKQEYILWKNYVEEVAPWLDKFDNGKAFQNRIPALAARHEHLKYSILALSARQMERMDPSQTSSGSLALYQKAIHLLLPDLVTKNSAVIASCVILCVLEMMSCNPKEWRRHLDGCAVLFEAANIHGTIGGLNQALFWCYARMDVCGGLISEEVTNISMEKWTSQPNIRDSAKLFRGPTLDFDMYANYAVFLLGRVLRLLFCPSLQNSKTRHLKDAVEPLENWHGLFAELERWRRDRPDEMLPLLTVSVSKMENESPFPTILYGAIPAISSNQLYHTGAILMLQEKPKEVRLDKDSKSVIWHARQICGIAESNAHHGSWINALQPLYIAGKIMSHRSEHKAILRILERIEQETGWGTKWRANDLLNFWGDDEE